MPTNLTLMPTKPAKSSKLALPPSPFSPRFPLSPEASAETSARPTAHFHSPRKSLQADLPAAPTDPLHWLWQCHLCNRVYQLGVTRRCLDDGHYFCSGTTTVKKSRKGSDGKKRVVKHHRACASEFDYAGWKAWGKWRREVGEMVAKREQEMEDVTVRPLFAPEVPSEEDWFSGLWAKKGTAEKEAKGFWGKDCWGTCDYPSECRWGKQYGVATPALPPSPPPLPEKLTTKAKTTFEDLLLTMPETNSDVSGESMQSPPLSPEAASLEEPTKQTTFDDLLESVKRRKRRSSGSMPETPSPLSAHPPSPTTISMARAMDLAGSSEQVEKPSVRDEEMAGQSALQKAFDDFDLDFRTGLGRAGAVLTGFVGSARNTAALEEEKAEGFVRGLTRSGSRRKDEVKGRRA